MTGFSLGGALVTWKTAVSGEKRGQKPYWSEFKRKWEKRGADISRGAEE